MTNIVRINLGHFYKLARPHLHLIFILALFVVAAGCSLKLIYNNLDYLIPQYVEDMVSLNDVLEEKVEQRTLLLLSWHRSTQLDQYADWLRTIQKDTSIALTQQKVNQHIGELTQFWQSLLFKINDAMARLLPLLDQAQQSELFESIEEKNDEFREKYIELDKEDRLDNNFERTLDNFENWIGDLTDEQELAVQLAAKKLINTAELRLLRRLEWQTGIRNILAESNSKQNKTDQLRKYLSGFVDTNNASMEKKSNLNKDVISKLIVQIFKSMTQDQKDYFIDKTNKYIRTFDELKKQ